MIKFFHPYNLKVCGDMFRFMTTGIICKGLIPLGPVLGPDSLLSFLAFVRTCEQ